ncbi:MAG: hypothetical protein JXB10_08740 [Pirellulales bacterium]|nr:hypothetical protein [Pirellulales bacterium]
MAIQLVSSSVVVAAQHFNPSVAGQHWLVTNNVVFLDEIQVGSVFTDMFVQVSTRDFNLLIVPENCQIHIARHVDPEKQQKLISDRLGKIITLLPHTPYTGVGLNFIWHFFPDNETVEAACRRLFFSESMALHRLFNSIDARFGGYLSKNWKSFRLRLDIKPIMIALPDGQQNELIQLAFNYHRGILGRPEPWRDVVSTLEEWDATRDDSSSIVNTAATMKGQLP